MNTSAHTVLRPSSSQQFLALVPALCGFLPKNSIVVVMFATDPHTRRQRSRGTFRVDLPETHTPRECANLIDGLTTLLRRLDNVEAVAPVIYTDHRFADQPQSSIPWRGLWPSLQSRLRGIGLIVTDMCCVAADGWASYLDDDVPPGGRPLSDIDHDPLRFEAQMTLNEPLTDLDEVATLPAPDTDLVTRLESDLDQALQPYQSARTISDVLGTPNDPTSVAESVESAAALAHSNAGDVADDAERRRRLSDDVLLAAAMQVGIVRELVLIHAAFGSQLSRLVIECAVGLQLPLPPVSATSAPLERESPVRVCAPIIRGEVVVVPQREHLHKLIDRLRPICAALPPELRCGPQAALAWLYWALGLTSVAWAHIGQARELDPDHHLLTLIAQQCERGALPSWAAKP